MRLDYYFKLVVCDFSFRYFRFELLGLITCENFKIETHTLPENCGFSKQTNKFLIFNLSCA